MSNNGSKPIRVSISNYLKLIDIKDVYRKKLKKDSISFDEIIGDLIEYFNGNT